MRIDISEIFIHRIFLFLLINQNASLLFAAFNQPIERREGDSPLPMRVIEKAVRFPSNPGLFVRSSHQYFKARGIGVAILLFRQKDPKPLTPCPASLDGVDASSGMAGQLAVLTQCPPGDKSVRPWGRTAGVGQEEEGGLFGMLQIDSESC